MPVTEMVEVRGGELEVLFAPGDTSAAGARPLVFLHEGLGSLSLWRGLPERVRDAAGGAATLAYSRHGYGRSAPARLPRPVSYMHHEADVVLPELLARFGLDRPVLVGHSDGASIALLYAGAGHPVAGLVLIAPHVFVEEVAVASIAAAKVDSETTDLRDRMGKHHDDPDATFRGWNDVWLSPAFRTWNIEDRLPAITCPVLLIQGDADQYGTLAQLDAVERGVRGSARRVVVPEARHSPHLDAPEVTLDEIVGFVRRKLMRPQSRTASATLGRPGRR